MSEEIQAKKDTIKENAILALQNEEIPDLPPAEALMKTDVAHPLNWEPTIHRAPFQSDDSFAEQESCLNMGLNAVDDYLQQGRKFVRGITYLGPPGEHLTCTVLIHVFIIAHFIGAGKTHVLSNVTAYAISRGLRTCPLTISSKRARQIGQSNIFHNILQCKTTTYFRRNPPSPVS